MNFGRLSGSVAAATSSGPSEISRRSISSSIQFSDGWSCSVNSFFISDTEVLADSRVTVS
ncbi:hypothetical protein VQ056_18565 [Paenibacillus sp. JTLBN-2024]